VSAVQRDTHGRSHSLRQCNFVSNARKRGVREGSQGLRCDTKKEETLGRGPSFGGLPTKARSQQLPNRSRTFRKASDSSVCFDSYYLVQAHTAWLLQSKTGSVPICHHTMLSGRVAHWIERLASLTVSPGYSCGLCIPRVSRGYLWRGRLAL
jgi:hypothetical protein